MALPPGSTLGPYEILSFLGAGGMGEVYRARDPRLNRDVAIKVLPARPRRRRESSPPICEEAQAVSALVIRTSHHPRDRVRQRHRLYRDGVPQGKSLDALIPQRGMRLEEFLRIAIPLADALAAAHASGIIHRDLKPANVMVGTAAV